MKHSQFKILLTIILVQIIPMSALCGGAKLSEYAPLSKESIERDWKILKLAKKIDRFKELLRYLKVDSKKIDKIAKELDGEFFNWTTWICLKKHKLIGDSKKIRFSRWIIPLIRTIPDMERLKKYIDNFVDKNLSSEEKKASKDAIAKCYAKLRKQYVICSGKEIASRIYSLTIGITAESDDERDDDIAILRRDSRRIVQ